MLLKLLLQQMPEISVDESGQSTRLIRSGLLFGLLLLTIFFIWGITAPIHGAVVTSGIVKIDLNSKTLQHLEGGIIKEIRVREGSQVKKGQVLLLLEDVLSRSQLDILKDRHYAAKAKEVRLLAQKRNRDHILFPQELSQITEQKFKKILANEIELFNSTRKNFLDQIKLLKFEITQTEQGLKGSRQEMEAIKAGIGFIKKQLNANQSLKKKGYIEESTIWDQERLLAEKRERIGALLASDATSRTRITDTRLRIITLENSSIQKADDELKETQKELLEIIELLRPAEYAFERTEVVAPLAGQIINIKVNTVGGVIRPGEDLMELVPNQRELIIEAKIKTNDIANVHLDQLTYVQLLAYSSRRTPMLTGKVSYISEDAIEDPRDPDTVYYLCHIKVDAASITHLPDNIIVSPGMPITAFIQTNARTFIDFILDPIVTHARKGLRED